MTLELPASYLAMPRWWHRSLDSARDDRAWLAALPGLIEATCVRWRLTIDGAPMHGSNALVVPVRRGREPLALRLAPPDERFTTEVRALRFWGGRGVVRLVDADEAAGIALLERLDGARSLAGTPLAEAIPAIGGLVQRLAIPAPDDVPHTREIVRARIADLPDAWARLGEPFPQAVLDAAIAGGEVVATIEGDLAVNGDLHGEQVLRGEREPWLVVDPLLYRGDIGYDLARVIWTRVDEMTDAGEIRHWIGELAEATGLDWDWVIAGIRFRTVDYWLWGLAYGLTEDPVRCARLMAGVME